jgi:hypothetical protein
MKIVNTPRVVVTEDDLKKLLVRFVEKKTGKKVEDIQLNVGGYSAVVALAEEVLEVEEQKNG